MRISRLWAIFSAAVFLLSLQLISPAAYADSYQIAGLGIDNVTFYGLSASGQAVFDTYNCAAPGPCYGSQATGYTNTLPALAWDNGSACASSLPSGTSVLASICNNGREVYYGYESGNYGVEGLYDFLGSDTPQLISSGFFTGGLHMNGLGNIVFDNASYDEWYEAVDLSPSATAASISSIPSATTPEPSTLLLLATGIFIPVAFFFHRRRRTTLSL